MVYLARLARDRGLFRIDWTADANEERLSRFYDSLGGEQKPDDREHHRCPAQERRALCRPELSLARNADGIDSNRFQPPELPLGVRNKRQGEVYAKSSLDLAMKDAFRKARRFLMEIKHLTEDEAIALMSAAVDFGVIQVVDGNWGVHAIVRKSLFNPRI